MTRKETLEHAREVVNRIFHGHKDEVTIKGWVMRDKCKNLWFAKFKPHKTRQEDWSHPYFPLENKDFPSVKWEDDEPTEAELTIKLHRK